MASFTYTVRDKTGKIAKGKLEGESKEAVQSKLTADGLHHPWSSTSRAAWPR